ALLLGRIVGDILLTLAVHAIVDDFKAVAPAHPLLVAQAERLTLDAVKARQHLELVAESPGLPSAAIDVARSAAALLAPLTSASLDAIERRQLFARLDAKRQELARAFVADDRDLVKSRMDRLCRVQWDSAPA